VKKKTPPSPSGKNQQKKKNQHAVFEKKKAPSPIWVKGNAATMIAKGGHLLDRGKKAQGGIGGERAPFPQDFVKKKEGTNNNKSKTPAKRERRPARKRGVTVRGGPSGGKRNQQSVWEGDLGKEKQICMWGGFREIRKTPGNIEKKKNCRKGG